MSELGLARMNSLSSFNWYVLALDVKHEYKHRHIGVPSKFPCKVLSFRRFKDGYEYAHIFIYPATVLVCENCGGELQVWPEIENTGVLFGG